MLLSRHNSRTKHQINICVWTREELDMLTNSKNQYSIQKEMQDYIPRPQSTQPIPLGILFFLFFLSSRPPHPLPRKNKDCGEDKHLQWAIKSSQGKAEFTAYFFQLSVNLLLLSDSEGTIRLFSSEHHFFAKQETQVSQNQMKGRTRNI